MAIFSQNGSPPPPPCPFHSPAVEGTPISASVLPLRSSCGFLWSLSAGGAGFVVDGTSTFPVTPLILLSRGGRRIFFSWRTLWIHSTGVDLVFQLFSWVCFFSFVCFRLFVAGGVVFALLRFFFFYIFFFCVFFFSIVFAFFFHTPLPRWTLTIEEEI